MAHLLNFLLGLGSAANPLGTVPQYRVPTLGDRVKDARKISGDFRNVGQDLDKASRKVMREAYGEVDDRATAG